MKNYVELVQRVFKRISNSTRGDRTGVGTTSVFGPQLEFNLQKSFPLLALKSTNLDLIEDELRWFLRGDTNANNLIKLQSGKTIWSDWADKDGECGPIYGAQWHWGNQFDKLLDSLCSNPFSRRHIVNAWNVDKLPDEKQSPQANVLEGKMSIAPCHTLFQVYVEELTLEDRIALFNEKNKGFKMELNTLIPNHDEYVKLQKKLDVIQVPGFRLSLKMYQRSADLLVGVPFNIASYALLTHILVNTVNTRLQKPTLTIGDLIITFGDAHIYVNQYSAAKEFLDRAADCGYFSGNVPALEDNVQLEVGDWYNYSYITSDDFIHCEKASKYLRDYNPKPHIAMPVAV